MRLVRADHPCAAPFVADFNDDGKPDVIVGQFPEHRLVPAGFFLYLNVGTRTEPRFDAGRWLRAGRALAGVTAGCYTGSGPQLVDFDGDGRRDVVSVSCFGELHVFGAYHDERCAKARVIRYVPAPNARFAYNTRLFVHDWNDDGKLDLLAGNSGRVYWLQNKGSDLEPQYSKPRKLLADGQPLKSGLASPFVADWDGDGRADLLLGTSDGSVLWCRDQAVSGTPRLGAPKTLVPPGRRGNWIRQADQPYVAPAQLGVSARVCVADLNADGLLDLVVGDWVRVKVVGKTLTESQAVARKDALRALSAIEKECRELAKVSPGESVQARTARERRLRERRAAYDRTYRAARQLDPRGLERHGSVWFFRRLKRSAK